MTVDTLSEEKLAEIARGCEGVTPGPWVPSTFGSQVLTGDSWNTVCIFYEGAGNGPIANAKRNFQLAAWEDGRGATRIDANAFHIARLDPSTVLSLVTEVQSRRAAEASLTTARADGIEEAAKVADAVAAEDKAHWKAAGRDEEAKSHYLWAYQTGETIAASIRALSPPANEPADETEVKG